MLRARLRDRRGSPDERELARDLREQRVGLSRAVGPLEACASCARGQPGTPAGFDGGFCCASDASQLFTEDEAASLAMAGTRPRHMPTPGCAPAGCAFRDRHACTLDPAHRPNVCLRYLCTDARRELHDRGDLDRVEELIADLETDFDDFVRARAERRQRAELRAIHPLLADEA